MIPITLLLLILLYKNFYFIIAVLNKSYNFLYPGIHLLGEG